MKSKNENCRALVYDRPDYKELKEFNDELLNENSRLGRIISSENLSQSSENIHRAIIQTIVNNRHGVMR